MGARKARMRLRSISRIDRSSSLARYLSRWRNYYLIRAMMDGKNSFWSSVLIVLGLVSVLWLVQLIQFFGLFDFSDYGNWPQHTEGLKGILFSPFIHGSFEHLISNTLPILVLFTVLLNAYPKVAFPVLVFVHIASGTLVWLLAPETGVHIGISGIIYGIACFLIASGVFRRDRNSTTIAILVTLVYGGMVLGFLPKQGVSWQSHFYGALSGVVIAFMFRKTNLPPPHEFELEQHPEEKHFFDPGP
jgi:membrane associated rhomboid family serine protease